MKSLWTVVSTKWTFVCFFLMTWYFMLFWIISSYKFILFWNIFPTKVHNYFVWQKSSFEEKFLSKYVDTFIPSLWYDYSVQRIMHKFHYWSICDTIVLLFEMQFSCCKTIFITMAWCGYIRCHQRPKNSCRFSRS